MTLSPPVVTWARWWRLSSPRYSLLRALEYERLAQVALPGRSVDLGGGPNANYLHLLDVRGELLTLNIDPRARPTVVADLNNPLPFRDAVFDDVITLNTLEHVFEDVQAVQEIIRILKPGGRFHISVPFLYRVHGSPDDYSRHTDSWWRRLLLSLDVDESTLRIEPLAWEPLASAFSIVEFNRLRRFLKKPILLRGVMEDRRARRSGSETQHRARRNSDFPLGYFIEGKRRGEAAVPVETARRSPVAMS